MASALSPLRLLRQSLDWRGTSGRAAYAIPLIGFLILATGWQFWLASRTPPRLIALSIWPLMALLCFVAYAHAMRRLNDTGRSRWWWFLLPIPYLGIPGLLYLALARSRDTDRPASDAAPVLAMTVAAIIGLLLASRVFWHPYWIPAGSMKPTLQIGDYIVTTPVHAPERGDVLVFRHPVTGADYVKRLIGLPGDTVQIKDGRLYLNGTPVKEKADGVFTELKEPQGPEGNLPRCANDPLGPDGDCEKFRFRETLPSSVPGDPGVTHDILKITDLGYANNTPVFTVPAGHYFFMGDNRDNSTDSRFAQTTGGVGFVPRENLTGHARWIVFSSAGRSLLDPADWRSDRWFVRID